MRLCCYGLVYMYVCKYMQLGINDCCDRLQNSVVQGLMSQLLCKVLLSLLFQEQLALIVL